MACDPQELMDEAACFDCRTDATKESLKLALLCRIFEAGGGGGGGGAETVFEFDRSWDQDVTVSIDDTSFVSNVPGYIDLTTALDGQGYSAAKRTQVINALTAGDKVRVSFRGKMYYEMSPPGTTVWFAIKFCGSAETQPRSVFVVEMDSPPDPSNFWIEFGFCYEMWFDGYYKFRNVSMWSDCLDEQKVPPGYGPIQNATTADSTAPLAPDGKFYITTYGAAPFSAPPPSLLYIFGTSIEILT